MLKMLGESGLIMKFIKVTVKELGSLKGYMTAFNQAVALQQRGMPTQQYLKRR